jgi:hypothetical protein
MYQILVFLLIFTTFQLFGRGQNTSPVETIELLEEIKEHAIVIGNGTKEVHSFIDPKCSMSQRYLAYLYKRGKKMFKRYTIYLYLYELKRKKSGKIIRNIFDSEYPATLLKAFMVSKIPELDLDEEIDDNEIEYRIDEIRDVAERIGVYKRPYIIVNGRGK